MTADKSVGTKRALWGCVMLAVTAGPALAAYAQVMTAPAVQAPVQAPALKPSAVVTVPYMVAISYPAPGHNPPTASTSFAAVALSFFQGTTNPPMAAQTGATQSVDVSVDYASISQTSAIPAQTLLSAMTITAYKAGVVTMTMNFTRPFLASRTLSPAVAGRPQETLRFFYTQVTHTP